MGDHGPDWRKMHHRPHLTLQEILALWRKSTFSRYDVELELTGSFNGTSIEVLGSLAPDRGNFTASIDGVNKGMYSGYWVEPLPDTSCEFFTAIIVSCWWTLVFSVSGLSESEHTLVLTNLGGNRGNIFDLNRIIVNSTIDPLSYSSIGSSPQTKSQSAGGLIGGIVGGIAALAIIAGGVFWWLRRRKGAQRTDTTLIDLTGEEVKPYTRNESPNEGSPMTEYVLSSDGNSSVGDRYYSTPAYTILSIPQPPGSNVSSCPRSTVAGSIMGTDPPTPLAQGRYASQLSISQTSHSQGPFNDQISAIDPFHNRSDSLLSSNPTPAITTQLPYRLPSPNRSPITPPPGENTSSTLSRPSFVSDQKSSAAASIIHELRYQDSPINDDAARTRRADEDEARLRLVRRAEEDEARDRMERRRAEEEEVMTMPPPYAWSRFQAVWKCWVSYGFLVYIGYNV